MNWTTYTDEDGLPAKIGSDGGAVLADEEHGWGARITLEQPGVMAAFGITCGIYGWMVHTRAFTNIGDAQSGYEAMKTDLDIIMEMIPARSDPEVERKMDAVTVAISAFVDKFP